MPRSKFNNIKTVVDGIKFNSKGESSRYIVLRDRQKIGLIANLTTQVAYPLIVNGVKIARYVADFVYDQGGVTIVEDYKSTATAKLPVFRLKLKLMKACHGVTIKCVYTATEQ